MADPQPEPLDYAATKAALQRLVGRRVIASVDDLATGAGVADIGIGYLQPGGEFGEYPRDDEVTAHLITEQAEPKRGFRHPLWPSVSIHNVPGFEGWDYGSR